MWFRNLIGILIVAGNIFASCLNLANSKENTAIGTIDSKYYEMLKNKQFVNAFDYIKISVNRLAELQLAYHYILGTGVEINICKAVELLEKDYKESDFYQMSLLNIAYNSSWKVIAAIEGNHNAAFQLGMYYYNHYLQREGFILSTLDTHETILKNAYIHFRRSEMFGDTDARLFIEKILKLRPDFEESVTVDFTKTSIICPIRGN